ncbi:hypothetical protein [Dyella sp.]|uniref:hypothetical protein n=1 Tax=Dyella sp. TaxID=1869338 RepID=UPI00284D5BFC|nr:hypothetical protein [Dyella sp.]MDR3447604.1 hypothetical protein [Dyella sp.]
MTGKWLMATVVSAMLGFIHVVTLGYVWSHLVQVNPIPHWLITHGVTGNSLHGLLFTQDVIINVILCLPIVLVLRLLRPFHPWAYLATALLVAEAWTYRSIFTNPLPQGLGYGIYLSGLLMTVVAFVIASAAVGALARFRRTSP